MRDYFCYSNRGFFKIGDEDNNFYLPIKIIGKSYWVHINDEIKSINHDKYILICYISGKRINIYKDEDNNSVVSTLKEGTYGILKNENEDIILDKINSSIE